MHIPFQNTYLTLPPQSFSMQAPEPVAAPDVLAFNAPLAASLGIVIDPSDDLASVFSGNTVPAGAQPLAQLYAGHQFGNYNPQLGDGRAVLLGEVVAKDGTRQDIQLKGSGRTPYSRGGDGRAWLGPVLREYVISEAMHALGIPTTRALAAVSTGETVWRESGRPGAVLTRVAESHIRVGTFQVFAARQDYAGLQALLDYAIARHAPEADGPEAFLQTVIDKQAALIPAWMGAGFIHGVMNTDNCQIAGQTIDYGPCAFMDAYDSDQVFSSIDRKGRYAFSNQPDIILWNMAQLATSLVPLMPDAEIAVERFTQQLHVMSDTLRANWVKTFGAKLGLAQAAASDAPLITEFLALLQNTSSDFTNSFHALIGGSLPNSLSGADGFDGWYQKWRERTASEKHAEDVMRRANPSVIPRNHRIEQMIDAAVAGNMAPFDYLMEELAHPFEDRASAAELRAPPGADEIVQATFCGT